MPSPQYRAEDYVERNRTQRHETVRIGKVGQSLAGDIV
jgi:hypothetical protein